MIRGVVLDPSRNVVAGAKVSTSTGGGVQSRPAYTGPNGEFSLVLEPGTYDVRISANGFQEFAKSVSVEPSSAAPLEVVLQLAPNSDAMTVSATASYQVFTSSSTRTSTPLLNVPQSISVVSQDLIRDQAMQNMADVVRYIPGITMAQGEGHRDAPVIRGNVTTSDFYLNGMRDDVQYYRDLYNVERVEAVKGANALTFGRGGGGGVINRVTKEAGFFPIREITLQGGSFNNKRIASDFGHSLSSKAAFRVNGVYENSDSFRHNVNLERYGLAPTVTIQPGERTKLRFGYEYFQDGRVVDRGIPSFAGGPSAAHRSTFFGDPDKSHASAGVNLGTVSLEHQLGRVNIRNSTLIGRYDKFYQNVLPGAVNADQTLVSISGYSNYTQRQNMFNQTDVTGTLETGRLRHTLLMGSEFGRQRSDNFRRTGYFNGTATSMNVPFASPNRQLPVEFRQSASDANNGATNHIAAVYVQDQIELSRYFQVVAGVRYDSFNIDFFNNRNNENLSRRDNLISPRAGFVIKPVDSLSFYTSYSVSYLPSAGDQFSSLTATTQTLKPEKFTNYEVGAKWDIASRMSLTTALFRLDRTNTTTNDPNNPGQIIQTGSQRTEGYELAANGALTRHWRIVGSYSYQDAFISSTTTAAPRGRLVALVPRHTYSLWNNYQLRPRWSVGLGLIHQADMYAGLDNTVTLPSFTRVDFATFYSLTEKMRLQANVENLLDTTYYATAHSNNNIMPGFARTVRVGLNIRF